MAKTVKYCIDFKAFKSFKITQNRNFSPYTIIWYSRVYVVVYICSYRSLEFFIEAVRREVILNTKTAKTAETAETAKTAETSETANTAETAKTARTTKTAETAKTAKITKTVKDCIDFKVQSLQII